MNNNTLIIFLNSNRKIVLSFPKDVTEEEALEQFNATHEAEKNDVKKYFYVKDDTVSVDVYQRHYELTEDMKLSMDIRKAFIETKISEIRKKRDVLISNLDIPFWKALESRDENLQDYIAKLKDFLRNVPNTLRFNDIKENSDIAKYDPFGNIFEIALLDGGNGYKTPPSVKIDPPNTTGVFGFETKAVASIKDSKVVGITVIEYGCGYNFVPKVFIDPPEDGEPARAACTFPHNTLLTQDTIINNSKLHYS
tara:strand:- start:2788 stop:3543 length:756 start_codon:yes stop_codon:yes gene_type:complete